MTFASLAARALTRRRPMRNLRALATKVGDNPEGPMLTGYQDHVDKLMARADQMETSLKELRETYGKKQQAYLKLTMDPDDINGLYDFAGRQKDKFQNDIHAVEKDSHNKDTRTDDEVVHTTTVKWMDPDEIEALFDLAGRQKKEMEEQLQEMKKNIRAMKANFAVDAPDGESDGHIEEELEVVNDIIDHTGDMKKSLEGLKQSYNKKQEALLQSTTVKWMDPDEIEYLFDIAGRQKKELEEQLEMMKQEIEAMKANYAVDAPDGESDGHVEEELEEVKHIIDHSKTDKKAA